MSNLTRVVSLPRCLAVAFLVAGCVSISSANSPSPAPQPELLAGVAENGSLVLFSAQSPEDVMVVKITGLQSDEKILGLDRRPSNGLIYALGSTSRIYTVNIETGAAVAVGGAPFGVALQGSRFGFDFNPVVDRIRIVSDTGENLRVHPDTGQLIAMDGALAYAMGDSGAGTSPKVSAAAYINNDNDPVTGTVLYNIDANRGVLVQQIPPNDGRLITVGTLGVTILGDAGFDVATSDGTAYASFIPRQQRGHADTPPGNSARSHLYLVDLSSGKATWLGKIGGPKPLTSLTALGQAN
jgi:hypothetical protein